MTRNLPTTFMAHCSRARGERGASDSMTKPSCSIPQGDQAQGCEPYRLVFHLCKRCLNLCSPLLSDCKSRTTVRHALLGTRRATHRTGHKRVCKTSAPFGTTKKLLPFGTTETIILYYSKTSTEFQNHLSRNFKTFFTFLCLAPIRAKEHFKRKPI